MSSRSYDLAVYAGLAAATALFWWLCAREPGLLPVWAPWDFAPVQFLAFWLVGWWYLRGLWATAPAERPPRWRVVCFGLGMLFTYTVLLTRFEYMAEHMFFINRIQHIVMHHLGPLLIVLGGAGPPLCRGMPTPLVRLTRARWITRPIGWLQQPVVAGVLFVGLIYLWLIPSVHFRAMIDPQLYALMNWSMVLDGLLFWSLILDPRPRPQARLSYLGRAALAAAVSYPQIVLGAFIAFSKTDLYDFYHWCGRLYPGIGAVRDQTWGGVIVWVPGAMMSVAALVLVLVFWARSDTGRASASGALDFGGSRG